MQKGNQVSSSFKSVALVANVTFMHEGFPRWAALLNLRALYSRLQYHLRIFWLLLRLGTPWIFTASAESLMAERS